MYGLQLLKFIKELHNCLLATWHSTTYSSNEKIAARNDELETTANFLHVYERNFSNDKCMHAGIVPLMIVMRKNAEKYEELQDTTAPS
jgi:hypothetical protein